MFNYIKNNRLLFSAAIITGIISSLGYVFIAVLLQNLLDIATSQNMKLFAKLVVFSLAYFIILGIFMYLQSLFEKNYLQNHISASIRCFPWYLKSQH